MPASFGRSERGEGALRRFAALASRIQRADDPGQNQAPLFSKQLVLLTFIYLLKFQSLEPSIS